jgi:3-dehydroquinate dehydratase/shikimate dehydrogenase
MPTLVCVPIFVESPGPDGDDPIDAALADAAMAKQKGADLVEFRIDRYFSGSADLGGEGLLRDLAAGSDSYTIAQLRRLLAESPLPVILTCRPTWEGGEYDGDDADRVALFERLCCDTDTPPAYLDIELAAYTRSANLRQKINLCVTHPKQQRGVTTRLILSIHDFQTRPPDLDRRILAAVDEPACSVVKVAYRARSLRDNLDLFEILRTTPKPTIALGMGEFGLMSRVLAPKFGGFLTFASLRDEAATAPGQPTIHELLGRYRFRSIGRGTRLYGVIGWPVGHSLSPLIHNAGFAEIGWDGVYLPLPIAATERDTEANFTSLAATLDLMTEFPGLAFSGASVTIPHKENAARWRSSGAVPCVRSALVARCGAANTLAARDAGADTPLQWELANTDISAVDLLPPELMGSSGARVGVVGSGGVARALAFALAEAGATVVLYNRTEPRAAALAREINEAIASSLGGGRAVAATLDLLPRACCHAFINCTPVGMAGGPDPDGLSIPIPEMTNIDANTVFFDTVYNPIETPMLRAALARGCRTIDGVQMFVRQAAAQFERWTGRQAPVALFDRLCREKLQ